MAKKSNKNNYPKLKWVVMLAIVISIPVTIFTFNNAPTETRSQAAESCTSKGGGAGCYKYSCPSTGGYYKISGTCSISDSVCCANRPSGLTTDEKKCVAEGIEYDFFDFQWNKFPNAVSYTVYYKIEGTTTYKTKSTSGTHLVVDTYKNLGSKRLLWKVKAVRSSGTTSTSDVMRTDAPVNDCYWMTTP